MISTWHYVDLSCVGLRCPTCPAICGPVQPGAVRFVGKSSEDCILLAVSLGWIVKGELVLCPACSALDNRVLH